MNANAVRAGLFVIVLALLVKPVGAYLERVFERRQTFLDAVLLPIERWIHRLVGVDCLREMDWKRYSLAFGTFGLVTSSYSISRFVGRPRSRGFFRK